ncbi:TetR/AcrR family transcriptional regulator [Arenicella xantha]|uniref:TetR family transcriptional regulator n=1 Tax=Arenicella xantha TaxID=644221 RepID=A0A395JL95_9GAMM|nr:TetR/AcrR family transcriptional regulator [Arenicella xantha]RBP51563.1 TetR family transcriptional regulator [Arenicella xantha]
MARTREFEPETVLDAALDLFWRKGYKACSMADVVRQSGVARYGVYQAFKDKDQLYCAALKRYQQKVHDYFVKPLCGSRVNYDSLVQHFDRVLDQLENSEHEGCFAHQAAIERAGCDDNVNQIINSIFAENRRTYRVVIEHALADGEMRPLPIDDLVTFVMGIERALIAMTKQNCSLQERQDYVRCALTLLKP